MSDFKLTMKTAAEAIETGELIRRAAKLAPAHGLTTRDAARLEALAAKYFEYAAALYQVAGKPDDTAPDQAALL